MIDNAANSQVEFLQWVSAPGTWSPSIAETSTTDPSWDSAAAAFESNVVGIGAALSTASGATNNTHAWSTGATGSWASIGLDVFRP